MESAPSPVSVKKITVEHPRKVGEGMKAHVEYTITLELHQRSVGLGELAYTVSRRFSDFTWLREHLRECYPYLVVPYLPEKSVLNKTATMMGRVDVDDEFAEMRHRALQRWLERVAHHPDLSSTDLFKTFVSAPASIMASVREREGTASAVTKKAMTSGKSTFMKLLKNATGLASDAMAQVRGESASASIITTPRNAEDMAFQELEAYLYTQAPMLVTLYNAAAGLAARYKEEAERQRDYALSLRSLASVEGTTGGGSVGDGLNWLGVSSFASCTSTYEQACVHAELLVEKLADFVRGNKAVREALEARTEASGELIASAGEVERLRAHITALSNSHSANAGMERAKAEAEQGVALRRSQEAREYYNKAAEALLNDVERLRDSMRTDIQTILLDFTLLQLRTEQKISISWEQVLGKNLPVPPLNVALTPALGAE